MRFTLHITSSRLFQQPAKGERRPGFRPARQLEQECAAADSQPRRFWNSKQRSHQRPSRGL